MRERLTVAFALVGLLLVAVSFTARTVVLTDHLRAYEHNVLQSLVDEAAASVRDQESDHQRVSPGFLQGLTPSRTRLVYHVPGRHDVTTVAADYSGATAPGLWVVQDTDRGTLVLEADQRVVRGLLYPKWQLSLLAVTILVALAGALGYLVARHLARPFQALAGAAAALGRGRFDLNVPHSSVREVNAISHALEDSAAELRRRLSREQALAEHTSHALRTPLTSLRLELEDLRTHEALPAEVAAAVERSIGRIEQLDAVTGELVELTRGTSLLHGAEIPLGELAAATAQRWADELAQRGRAVSVSVEGDLETSYTPGPVEQILDLVLVDVMRRSSGPVQLAYDAGAGDHLRIDIGWIGVPAPRTPADRGQPLLRARAVATALGGRLDEDDEAGLTILIPRR